MFITRRFNVKTTEQHLIVRSDKSVAYVTNNKRLRSTFLPRDAMHKRGLCRHAVSIRPFVRLSVRHVRGFCQNE